MFQSCQSACQRLSNLVGDWSKRLGPHESHQRAGFHRVDRYTDPGNRRRLPRPVQRCGAHGGPQFGLVGGADPAAPAGAGGLGR